MKKQNQKISRHCLFNLGVTKIWIMDMDKKTLLSTFYVPFHKNCRYMYEYVCKTCLFTNWLKDCYLKNMTFSLSSVKNQRYRCLWEESGLGLVLFAHLKGQCHEIFCFWFFSWISFPPAPEYPIRTVSNFSENLQSQVKVHHQYQQHRWQILPPVLLVLLIPANLPPVSMTSVANNRNNIRLLSPYSELEGKTVSIR